MTNEVSVVFVDESESSPSRNHFYILIIHHFLPLYLVFWGSSTTYRSQLPVLVPSTTCNQANVFIKIIKTLNIFLFQKESSLWRILAKWKIWIQGWKKGLKKEDVYIVCHPREDILLNHFTIFFLKFNFQP